MWLGILVMVLVFGMTVVSCKDEPEETGPKFQETVTVLQIPNNRNGETFTMSLVKNGNTFVTETGTITGNNATAKFVVEKDLPDSTVLYYNEYQCYLSLKIGTDAVKVSTKQLGFRKADDGTYLGSQSDTYTYWFE